MNDDYVPVVIITIATTLAICSFVAVGYSVGQRNGIETGKVEGKNEGIVYCVEKPKECKIAFDYLKLQETHND
jgi:hypothetical protein